MNKEHHLVNSLVFGAGYKVYRWEGFLLCYPFFFGDDSQSNNCSRGVLSLVFKAKDKAKECEWEGRSKRSFLQSFPSCPALHIASLRSTRGQQQLVRYTHQTLSGGRDHLSVDKSCLCLRPSPRADGSKYFWERTLVLFRSTNQRVSFLMALPVIRCDRLLSKKSKDCEYNQDASRYRPDIILKLREVWGSGQD